MNFLMDKKQKAKQMNAGIKRMNYMTWNKFRNEMKCFQ